MVPTGLVNFAGGDIKGDDKLAKGGKAKNNNLFINTKDYQNIYEQIIIQLCSLVENLSKYQKKRKWEKL